MQIVFIGGWGFTQEHYQPFLDGLIESLSKVEVKKSAFSIQNELPTNTTASQVWIPAFAGNSPLAQRLPVVRITSESWYPDLNSEVKSEVDNPSCVSFPRTRESSNIIGIGHSLGVAYLLKHHAHNLAALINISGFPCFVKTPQQPYGTSPKILRAMQQKFDTHPEYVLQDFYQNCGVADAPLPDAKHYPFFAESLEMLCDTIFFTPPPCPTLSLHSQQDAIVSVSNTKHFGTETTLYNGMSHALPLTHTAQIIEDIFAFLTRHPCP